MIFRGQRIDSLRIAVQQQAGGDAFATHALGEEIIRQFFDGGLPATQINGEDTIDNNRT